MIRISVILLFIITSTVLATEIRGQDKAGTRSNLTTASSPSIRPKSRFIRANNLRVHYREWKGKGQVTLILLHGLYDTSKTWSRVGSMLAAKNYRVVAPDRRGSGSTQKPEGGYDYQNLALDVVSLVRNLNSSRVILVGHSAGAEVALTVAARHANLIESVILVDGGFWPKRPDGGATQPTGSCDLKRPGCRRKSLIEQASRNYDPAPLYDRVSIPILLVMAVPANAKAVDIGEARNHVDQVARMLRHGTAITIEDSGHWIQQDQPESLTRAIEGFITKRR